MVTQRVIQSFGIISCAMCLLAGCSGGDEVGGDKVATVPVKGTLTLDGKPHGPTTLSLTPKGEPSPRPQVGGAVAADGTFTLRTYKDGDGAPVGDYTVTLDANAAGGDGAMLTMGGGPAIQALTVTIPDGGTESLKIDLVSGAAKPAAGGGIPAPIGAQ